MTKMRGRGPTTPGPFALVALLLAAASTWWPTGAAAGVDARLDPPPALDLVAMVLTPSDLEAADLVGYGLSWGETLTAEETAAVLAGEEGRSDVGAEFELIWAGFQRMYVGYLDRPATSADPYGSVARRVRSYVMEYATVEGAGVGYQLVSTEPRSATIRDVPGTEVIGAESELTRYQHEDGDTGELYQTLDLTFRSGHLVAGVEVVDFGNRGPTIAEAESLARLLLDRLKAGLSGEVPGLGASAVRLSGEHIVADGEYYVVLDGQPVPYYGDRDIDTAARVPDYAGATESFLLFQRVETGDAGAEDDVEYVIEINRFPDARAASDRLRTFPTWIGQFPSIDDVEIWTHAPDLGDESVAFTATEEGSFTQVDRAYLSYVVRVEEVLAFVYLRFPGEPSTAALERLARAQAACLTAGACPDSVPAPPSLTHPNVGGGP